MAHMFLPPVQPGDLRRRACMYDAQGRLVCDLRGGGGVGAKGGWGDPAVVRAARTRPSGWTPLVAEPGGDMAPADAHTPLPRTCPTTVDAAAGSRPCCRATCGRVQPCGEDALSAELTTRVPLPCAACQAGCCDARC